MKVAPEQDYCYFQAFKCVNVFSAQNVAVTFA